MPEPYTPTHALTGGSMDDVRGYEHSVAGLLPLRRYRQHHVPIAVEGRPSRFVLGEETRPSLD